MENAAAIKGGALYVHSAKKIDMNYVSLKKNSCNKNGGSLYIENS